MNKRSFENNTYFKMRSFAAVNNDQMRITNRTRVIHLPKHRLFLFILIAGIFYQCGKKTESHKDTDAFIQKNKALKVEGKDAELIAFNKEAIAQSIKKGDQKEEALGYINLASIYTIAGNYKASQKCLMSASKIINLLSDPFLYTKLYYEYSYFTYATGLTQTALSYNAKALYHGKKLHHKEHLIGHLYVQRADYILPTYKDSALIYYHKGFRLSPTASNSANIGHYYLRQTQNIDSATWYTHKALSLMKSKKPSTVKQGIIYCFYADLLFEKGDHQQALIYYNKAADIFIKTKRINKLPKLYQQIAGVYAKLNNKEMKNRYSLKAEQLEKILKSSENEAIDFSLNEAIEHKNSDGINMVYIAAGGGILLLTVPLFIYIRSRNKKKSAKITVTANAPVKAIISQDHYTELLELAKRNDLSFIDRFEEINPSLLQQILEVNPKLTKSELSLCAMIWLGFSSKDIADFTLIQHRSVQTKKGRLRKKLNISSETDLHNFLTSL
ncbi:LuxR C-terminal-related transcriptional regulator [Chryseobacterium pennipullorum]|uniref:HTH luxR-type domain-containing protein n=1 Tax=Chryseobacterium pennipullorum TaxID=2258963 RepID=A0A3D9ALB4_9FLAO|nr:LuxR C-terminal-related transcriptional regulator [Chryseobacterium pennipullorum]REC42129.1 hypothetical protein DRF67_20860 [Chryseobacterium pennipullorum]